MPSTQGLWLLLALLLGAQVRAADFTAETLTSLIQARQVQTVEAALALLPAELRENYTLVFASRSLQEATPSAPRAILFGNDARLIVSFNGDAGERGYGALEIMQFDERSNRFALREVSFPPSGGRAEVSPDNPARCAACHGRPARPIWDTPPNWPGVYGERYRAGLSRQESAGIHSFLKRQAGDARYRYLLGARRFADRETYVAGARARYDGESPEPPNARLSVLLTTLTVRSLVSELSKQAAFAPYRYVLLAAAGDGCGTAAAFFPVSLQAEVTQAIAAYARASALASTRQELAKRQRLTSNADSYRAGIAASDPVQMRFIAERLVGLPSQRWSVALGSNDLAAPEGSLSLEQLLLERLVGNEPALRDLRSSRSFATTDAYCTELRRRSQRELSEFYGASGSERLQAAIAPTPANAAPLPQLLDQCAACHTGVVAPALPFTDPIALRPLLSSGGYAHGRLLDEILYRLAPPAGQARMPRGISITAQEQSELEEYFVDLSSGAGN